MTQIGTFQKVIDEKASAVAYGEATDAWENEDGVLVAVRTDDGEFKYKLTIEMEVAGDVWGGPDEDRFQGAADKVTRMRGEAADMMRKISAGEFPPDVEDSDDAAVAVSQPGDVTVNPTIKNSTNSHWERKVKQYLKEWYPTAQNETVEVYGETRVFEVDWSDVEIIVSGRMSKASGRARWYKEFGEIHYELKISKHLIENQDWGRVEQTIRHEAIHIWQYQTEGFSGGHGVDFRAWMNHPKFDCTIYAERAAADPKYEVICENCGRVGTRQKACKITKRTHLYNCGGCGGDLKINQLR